MRHLPHRPFRILLVEDNIPDVELMKLILGNCGLSHELHLAANGREAVDFVLKKGQRTNSLTPDLILLDLNTPLKNGYEVLREIKASRSSSGIPVIILSSSSSDKEVEEAYAAGAAAFITKPMDITRFEDAMKKLVDFWFGVAHLSTFKQTR